MRGIEVTQQDANETIVSITYADSASHNRSNGAWTFRDGKVSQLDPEGNVTEEEFFRQKGNYRVDRNHVANRELGFERKDDDGS